MTYLEKLNKHWEAAKAPRSGNAPTVISTFAGGGGSTTGYHMAGYRELLAVEWDKNAVDTLAANYPDLPIHHGDIQKLTAEEVMERTGLQPGELDLFDGSPPCQGFSTAGTRQLDDPRNTLANDYNRLLAALQPKTFIMENVKGMVKGKMKLLFAEILAELRKAGYQVAARVLNAAYYGVPQNRERLIFVGVRNDIKIAPTHPAPYVRPFTIKDAIEDLPIHNQDPGINHIWIDESPSGRNTKTWAKADAAPQGAKYAGQQRRAKWNEPVHTLTTGGLISKPYLRNLGCHPIATRTFSPREYARLTSFPDGYIFAGEWHEAYARIGNSVPPLLARAIAQNVRDTVLDKL